MAGEAAARAVCEAFLSFASTAVKTDFICVLMLDFTDAFLKRLFSFCLLLFSADLCVAKQCPPLIVINHAVWRKFVAEVATSVKSKVIFDTFAVSYVVDFSPRGS